MAAAAAIDAAVAAAVDRFLNNFLFKHRSTCAAPAQPQQSHPAVLQQLVSWALQEGLSFGSEKTTKNDYNNVKINNNKKNIVCSASPVSFFFHPSGGDWSAGWDLYLTLRLLSD